MSEISWLSRISGIDDNLLNNVDSFEQFCKLHYFLSRSLDTVNDRLCEFEDDLLDIIYKSFKYRTIKPSPSPLLINKVTFKKAVDLHAKFGFTAGEVFSIFREKIIETE